LSIVFETDRAWPAAAGAASLAVRVPAHQRLRGLLAALRRPLTATSANRSGQPPLTHPEAVGDLLAGRRAVLVDDGELPGGAPSTLVEVGRDGTVQVLRRGAFDPGRLPRSISAAVVENPVEGAAGTQILRGAARNA
jgi:L-threonylcarbamoyladenylate synthase